MTCIWNANLHRQRVDRSSRFSLEWFLHLDLWIPPKSRKHNKNIWSVVRLRFGLVSTSLNSLMDLLWRTIATSHITTDAHLYTITLSSLKMHIHRACTNRSRDTCHLLQIGSIRHHLDILTLLLSTHNINLGWNVHSTIPWLNLPQEVSLLWMLLIIGPLPENAPYGMQQLQHYSFGLQILIHQCSVTPLNGSTQPSSAVILPNIREIHIRRNIIWSLCDHHKWCFWMGIHLRRWRIWM